MCERQDKTQIDTEADRYVYIHRERQTGIGKYTQANKYTGIDKWTLRVRLSETKTERDRDRQCKIKTDGAIDRDSEMDRDRQ